MMANFKVPSWIELLQQAPRIAHFKTKRYPKDVQEQAFWKEQTLRFGFDIRHEHEEKSTPHWQGYFYKRFFEYTLRKCENNLQGIKAWEKSCFRRNGRHVDSLELEAVSFQDLCELLEWFPNLKRLTLSKCNSLLQPGMIESRTRPLEMLQELKVLEIKNVHILGATCAELLPTNLAQLIIRRSRGFMPEFFARIETLSHLKSLAIQECQGLELSYICKMPRLLDSLDLSHSGKSLTPDALLYLPPQLKNLKLNGWQQISDNAVPNLTQALNTLEIEGTECTAESLASLIAMPLKELNLSRTHVTHLSSLPRELKRLKLNQNMLNAESMPAISNLEMLEELSLAYIVAFDGRMDDAELRLPPTLKRLDLSYSGPFSKKTLRNLKSLHALETLKIASGFLDNEDLDWLPESLKELDLSLNSKITDMGIIQLNQLKELKSLQMDGCEQIRGSGLSSLSSSLTKLSLAGCHRLSGKSLVHLPSTLEELHLDSCDLVTNTEIAALPNRLHMLSLAGCQHITNDALIRVCELPLLHTISLAGCPRISDSNISKQLKRKFEGTIILKAPAAKEENIELHPSISMLKKLTRIKLKFLYKLQPFDTKVP